MKKAFQLALLTQIVVAWFTAFLAPVCAEAGAIPAFPGAEGFGAFTPGGRGGKVFLVTNLNDSGPGSLRAACEAEGPRIVVFRVSGIIELQSNVKLKEPYITIAGQSAPGDGICLKNYPMSIDTNDVIIRYLRFRPGDESGAEVDALGGRGCKNVIIDHCSASWSIDECVSFYRNENVTIQWCLISESLRDSHHHKGAHGYGGIWGGNNASYHHNLFAHHSSRNPRFASGEQNIDYRNNVIYNWGDNSAYGGEGATVNMVANYYKFGPATSEGKRNRIVQVNENESRWYIADNYITGYPEITVDNWNGGVQGEASLGTIKVDKPFPTAPVRTQTAEKAYTLVLAHAGANLPRRDPLDMRIIEEVRTGTATYGETYAGGGVGIIDSHKIVGGWPQLNSTTPPVDTDQDGMPDEWEVRFGLNPDDAADSHMDKDGDGYTNIEEYLNGTTPTEYIDYRKPENNKNSQY